MSNEEKKKRARELIRLYYGGSTAAEGTAPEPPQDAPRADYAIADQSRLTE